MGSLPLDHYVPPVRSRSDWRSLWRALWRLLRADPRFKALEPAERRKCRLRLLALHEVRDYLTGLLDADLPRIAEAADMGRTCAKEALRVLWKLGYLEI